MTSTLLRIQRDTLVLESFSLSGIQTLLKDSFSSFVDEFSSFSARFSSKEPALAVTALQSDFLREVSKQQYMSMSAMRAYVPEGLDVDYLKYSEVLLEAAEHASVVLSDVLSPYSTFLSQMISHTDQKFSTVSYDKDYVEMEKAREKLNKSLGACFATGSMTTESSYGKVIRRNNDWLQLFHNMTALTTLVNKVERTVLTKKIAECVELLEIINKKILRNELDGISEEAVKNLANGCYQVASELEYFVAIYYKVQAFTGAVQRTVDNVKEAFKETAAV